jgi:hypothetical protein|tara:strand:+ start:749 stop:940 length:192 start_codon:yes stop_codon:yes gene_type:complete
MAKYKIDYLVGEAKRCKNGFKIGDRIVEKNIVIEADTYANLEIELAQNHRYMKKRLNITKINN